MELVDEKKQLPTGKTITRGNLGFHCASVCSFCLEIFIDKQLKAVGNGTEIKAAQAKAVKPTLMNSDVIQSTV